MSHAAISNLLTPLLIAGLTALASCGAVPPAASAATANAEDDAFGLAALFEGQPVALATLKVDVEVKLQGDLASVTLTQIFENPYPVPVHARYTFPLPADAAVYAMRMTSGDRMIEAEIRPKPEARAVFEHAKERGQQASLLDQHRPNVFTQEVANLTPGAPVRVELEYAHAVEKSHGDYRFHFPMVAGPRYLAPVFPGESASAGAPTREPGDPEALEVGVWSLPASPPVAPLERLDRERISLRIELDAGVPLQRIDSPTHPLTIETLSDSRRTLELASGRTLDDRDFELHYRLAGDEVAAGLTTFADGAGGFLSVLLEPPAMASETDISARELVFVLDCSGSMRGTPLAASKRFMRRTLRNLRPGDSFRIIRFSDKATPWSEVPLPATPDNLRAGERYVDSLFGGGGTHMASGVRAALAPPVPEGSLRLVVFLTDGYIGNDVEIVRLIEHQRGEARLFSFGIGSSVNRYLIQEMARAGRGASRIVTPSEDAEAAADELVARLASPVLTDIEIDWGDAQIARVFPSEIPDLFLGQTLRVMARYLAPGTHRATIRGRVAGEPVQLPLDLSLPADDAGRGGDALPIVWARTWIEDLMVEYLSPALDPHERNEIEKEVTRLGLAHRLMTRFTSFVAVAKEVVNPGGSGLDVEVEVAQAAGVPDSAYPPEALPGAKPAGGKPHPPLTVAQNGGGLAAAFGVAGAEGFHGSSGPEPSTGLALLAIGAAGAVWWRRRAGAHCRPGGS